MKGILFHQNLVLFLLLLVSVASTKTYNGYKVYEVTPQTHQQADVLHAFTNNVKFDFWKEGRYIGDPSDVMVAPEDQWYFERELALNGLQNKVVVEDVESLIQQDKVESRLSRAQFGDVTFRSYMLYDEHMAYLRKLARIYPNIVTVESIGQSYEGRDILSLKISSGPSQTATPKPIIFVDAGIHCREWIAPPVALYIIQQLAENTTNAYLYQNIDWVIVPNLNPDGYVYTQKEDRLWRKNRRLTNGQSCYGTDLNRNFEYFWMFDGASDNSCTEIYAGPEPFSEPETRALRDWFLRNGQDVKLYLTFHSFGEMILYPWGYAAVLPDDAEELQQLGERAGRAIDQATRMGSSYVINTSAIELYPAAGGSDDWVKGVAGVELAYTIELPNGDAPYWFMLPARQILPVVEETFEGVRVYHNYIEEKFVTNVNPAIPRSAREE